MTPAAASVWEALDEPTRERILGNVWCGGCGGVNRMVWYRGRVEQGNLVLEGTCPRCGGRIGRLVEREDLEEGDG